MTAEGAQGLDATKALHCGRWRGVARLRLRNSASFRCCRTSCHAPHGQQSLPPDGNERRRCRGTDVEGGGNCRSFSTAFSKTRVLLRRAPPRFCLVTRTLLTCTRNIHQVRVTEPWGPPPRAATASNRALPRYAGDSGRPPMQFLLTRWSVVEPRQNAGSPGAGGADGAGRESSWASWGASWGPFRVRA